MTKEIQYVDSNGRLLSRTEQSLKEQVADHATQLAQIMSQNNNSVIYGYDANGNIQTITEKDPSNNVVKTVTYTYDSTTGNVTRSVTVMNGKTTTTTYNYDASGNITSTSNVMS